MKRKDAMPLMVYVGLYGLRSRKSALGFVWLSVLLAVASVAYGRLVNPLAYEGAIFLLAAIWYWYAIRWVDVHSTWDNA